MAEAENEILKRRMTEAEIDMQKREMLLRDFRNATTINQAHINIKAMFGKKGYSERTCQRWFKKFKNGDFNLHEKPNDDNLRVNALKLNKKTIEPVAYRPEPQKPPPPPPRMPLKNADIEKLIQKKSELTISKVFSSGSIRAVQHHNNVITNGFAVKKIPPFNPPQQIKQLVPNGRAGLSVKVPSNVANKLTNKPVLTERHSIGEGNRSFPLIADSQAITVQFQNISPEQAIGTMRKVPERTIQPVNSNKRASLPTSTVLGTQKGVIYLNPQEIFKQNFGSQNKAPLQKPADACTKTYVKSGNTQRPVMPTLPPPQRAPINIDDSDSDDDIIFPENISIPPPKKKAYAETFTTYWDMETGTPILLNPTEEPEAPASAVIEID